MFNPNAFFFFFLTEALCYHHAIYTLLLHHLQAMKMRFLKLFLIQKSKFGGNVYKFCGKSKKNLNSAEFMGFVFSMSVSHVSCVIYHLSSALLYLLFRLCYIICYIMLKPFPWHINKQTLQILEWIGLGANSVKSLCA